MLKQFSRRWSLIEAHLAWERDARPGCGRLTSLGSRCRQQVTNSRNDLENGPSRVGGGFLGIRNRTWTRYIVRRRRTERKEVGRLRHVKKCTELVCAQRHVWLTDRAIVCSVWWRGVEHDGEHGVPAWSASAGVWTGGRGGGGERMTMGVVVVGVRESKPVSVPALGRLPHPGGYSRHSPSLDVDHLLLVRHFHAASCHVGQGLLCPSLLSESPSGPSWHLRRLLPRRLLPALAVTRCRPSPSRPSLSRCLLPRRSVPPFSPSLLLSQAGGPSLFAGKKAIHEPCVRCTLYGE